LIITFRKKQSGGSSKPPLTFDPTRSYVPPGLEEMIDEQASKYDKSIRDSAKAALEVSSLVEYVRAADEGPSNWDEERETRELIGTAIRDADKRAKSAASQYAAERKAASDKKPWPAFEQVQSLFRVIGMDPKKAAKVSEHSKIPESRW
jgi:hypothetical protein